MRATRRRDDEHRIQCACVRWFRLMYPRMALLLCANANGGARDVVTGARLKAEGVVRGYADLTLYKPNSIYHALLIEMKTRTGRQSASQKEWQLAVEQAGYRYVVVRSLDEFIAEITLYLNS